MGNYRRIVIILFVCLVWIGTQTISAQIIPTPIVCGDIISAETTASDPTFSGWAYKSYSLQLNAGDSITLVSTPLGQATRISMWLWDPGNSKILDTGAINGGPVGQPASIQAYVVGATGTYRIENYTTPIGAYTLTVGCTLRDGTVIEPGSSGSEDTSGNDTQPPQPPTPGFGFPGLPPVDLSTAPLIPMALGQATQGSIQPNSTAIVGFTFSGQAGQPVDINFTRSAGNLNLGLAVVRAGTTEVVFFTALVNSPILISRFSLPVAGDYVMAVFPISLIPPATPEQTSYAVTVTFAQ